MMVPITAPISKIATGSSKIKKRFMRSRAADSYSVASVRSIMASWPERSPTRTRFSPVGANRPEPASASARRLPARSSRSASSSLKRMSPSRMASCASSMARTIGTRFSSKMPSSAAQRPISISRSQRPTRGTCASRSQAQARACGRANTTTAANTSASATRAIHSRLAFTNRPVCSTHTDSAGKSALLLLSMLANLGTTTRNVSSVAPMPDSTSTAG